MQIAPTRPFHLTLVLVLTLLVIACGPAPTPASEATDLLGAGDADGSQGLLLQETAIAPTGGATATAFAAAAGPTPASIEARAVTALGDPDAPVTVVEYSDYQCPFCRRHFQETFPRLKEEYIDTGRIYYVFKDFPIASLHPLAYRLHEAALCVGDADGGEAYWEAHDLFFGEAGQFQASTEAAIDEAILDGLSGAGLPDVGQCLQDQVFAAEVQAGIAEGQQLGVSGTPTFYINGYPIVGAQPYNTFANVITLAENGELADAFRRAMEQQVAASATATAQAARPAEVPLGNAPAKGNPDAPVIIVEYSDYQCPFCLRHFQETMPQLEAYIEAGQVLYVFKDFPIARSHPQAPKAHEAAHCARELGGEDAYWEMHDLLFANQSAWAGNADHVSALKSLAAEIGLEQASFDACFDSGRYATAVNADLAEGQSLGVSGTPTFFINGQRLVGAQPFAVFQQVLEQAGAEMP